VASWTFGHRSIACWAASGRAVAHTEVTLRLFADEFTLLARVGASYARSDSFGAVGDSAWEVAYPSTGHRFGAGLIPAWKLVCIVPTSTAEPRLQAWVTLFQVGRDTFEWRGFIALLSPSRPFPMRRSGAWSRPHRNTSGLTLRTLSPTRSLMGVFAAPPAGRFGLTTLGRGRAGKHPVGTAEHLLPAANKALSRARHSGAPTASRWEPRGVQSRIGSRIKKGTVNNRNSSIKIFT